MTISEQMKKIQADENVQKALEQIKEEDSLTIEQQKMLTEIPAPPFKEEKRAEAYKKLLEDYDLEDVHIDEEGNVFGKRSGTGDDRYWLFLHIWIPFFQKGQIQLS